MSVNWKRIAKGAAFGLAASVGGAFLARRQFQNATTDAGRNQALAIAQLGQRGGSVVAAKFGGWQGVLGFQLADYIIDRYNINRTNQQRFFGSGTQAGVLRA